MPATYVHISEEEMLKALKVGEPKAFRQVYLLDTKEMVFDMPILYKTGAETGMVVRVYSSVTKYSGARDVGKDAIRVVLYSTKFDRPLRKAKRVNRTTNWEKNMISRVKELHAKAVKGMKTCQHCKEICWVATSHSENHDGALYYACSNKECVDKTGGPWRGWCVDINEEN